MSLTKTIKTALVATRVLRFAHKFSGQAAVVLRYHSIQDRPEQYDNTIGCDSIHATSVFERHVELIARRFNAVSLDDISCFLRGEKSLPPRAVAISFDDGYKDNLRFAAPILNRFGIPGTFYLLVDSVDRSRAPWYCVLRHAFATAGNSKWKDPATAVIHELKDARSRHVAVSGASDICAKLGSTLRERWIEDAVRSLDPAPFPNESDLMMSWDDARSLAKSGHIIGSHTMTHPNVAHVSAADARFELTESKLKLEKELGQPVKHFSYPHPALSPQWNEATLKITDELGYTTAVVTTSGAVRADTRVLAIPRTYIPRDECEFLFHMERTLLSHTKGTVQNTSGRVN